VSGSSRAQGWLMPFVGNNFVRPRASQRAACDRGRASHPRIGRTSWKSDLSHLPVLLWGFGFSGPWLLPPLDRTPQGAAPQSENDIATVAAPTAAACAHPLMRSEVSRAGLP
jgi:hypothetical protein